MDPERDLYGEDDEKLVSRSGLHNLEKHTEENPASSKKKTPEDTLLEGIQSSASSHGLFNENGDEMSRLNPLRAGVAYGAFKGIAKLSNRKKAAAGGAVLVIAGILTSIFIIASGPGQIVQLASLLEHSFKNSQNESFKVSSSLFNYSNESDPGLNRAGLLGRTFLKPAFAKLNDIGINLEANAGAGLNSASIDANKLSSKYPELEGMSPEETKSWIADHFGVDESVISQVKGSNSYNIDAKNFSLSDDQKLMSSVVGEIGSTSLLDSLKNGDLISAINLRFFSDYLNVSSMFHPFERLTQAQLKKLANRAAAKESAQEEEQTDVEPTESEANGAVAGVEEDDSSLGNPIQHSLLIAGTACAMRGIGQLIPIINRDRVVLPALIVGVGFMAEGDQIKSNQDVSLPQIGGSVDSLTNSSGQSVWQGGDIQHAEGLDATGPFLSSQTDLAQAFEGTSGAAIVKWADDAASATTGGILPASIVCSKGGQALQVVLSVGFAAGDVFSEGALTPAILGVLAKQADGFLVSAIAMHFVKNFVLSKTTATLAKDAFSGPVGGDLMEAGAGVAAQLLEATQGGSIASPSVAQSIAYEDQQQENQQFASESIFSRLFDINDYRSIAGKLADNFNANLSLDFASLSRSFGGLGSSLISNLSSIFLPKSHAANGYKSVVSTFAISPSILNNPALANPYTNDDAVSSELTASCGPSVGTTSVNNQTVINCPIITRAMTCFGVDIYQNTSSGTPLWDVTPKVLPDPTSDAYKSANCGQTDLSWARIVMFVKSTRTMNAIACTMGSDQACTDEDYHAAANSSQTTTNTNTSSSCSSVASSSSYFNVQGKTICSGKGQPYIPYGISIVDDLEGPNWCTAHNEAAADAQIQAAGQASWHANAIRLQVSENHFAPGNNCVYGGKTYTPQDAMARLGQEVSEIEQIGKVPIINDDTELTGDSPAPTQTTINFWNAVTSYLGSQNTNNQYGNVIFDIYNEPVTTGSTWANGGTYKGQSVLGMQQVINAIRGGSQLNNNLIFVEGQGQQGYTHSASLNVLDTNNVTGTNLVYAYHHVNLNKPQSAWEDTMGLKSGINAPIVDGEWTQYASPRTFECYENAPNNISAYFSLMQQNNIGMIFWSLEPGVGTVLGPTSPHPVSDSIASWFPENPSGYSTPSSFSGNYSCAYDSSGNLTGQGAGTQVQNYFAQASNSAGP